MHVQPLQPLDGHSPPLEQERSVAGKRLWGGVLLICFIVAEMAALGGVLWIVSWMSAPTMGAQIERVLLAYAVFIIFLTFYRASDTRSSHRLAVIAALICSSFLSDRQFGESETVSLWLWLASSAVAILVFRKATRRTQRRAAAWMRPIRSIAFVGNSPSAARMLTQLEADDLGSIELLGFFDDRHARTGPLNGRLPRLGGVDDVVGYLQEQTLSEVFVALPWSASQRMAELLERLRFLPLTVRLIPDHLPPTLIPSERQRVDDVVMPTLMVPPFSTTGGFIKRAIDLTASLLLLLPLVPLFVMVAILIKLDSPGPIFFRQARSGQFGRSFLIFKFRSLHALQADAAAETLVTSGDKRVTKVGRILRKYSIDELPQIFNVLLGHMSLVGPRPHAPRAKANGRVYSDVLPDYALRYRVKPGMTGWAQVNGWRGNTDTEEQLRRRVEFDFNYIGAWSLKRDMLILLRTIPSMLMPPPNNA